MHKTQTCMYHINNKYAYAMKLGGSVRENYLKRLLGEVVIEIGKETLPKHFISMPPVLSPRSQVTCGFLLQREVRSSFIQLPGLLDGLLLMIN